MGRDTGLEVRLGFSAVTRGVKVWVRENITYLDLIFLPEES